MSLEELEKRVEAIEKRNTAVEADKAWETSSFRTITIVGVTYVVATITFWVIGNDSPFKNALIPTIGFALSVQSLPFIKHLWVRWYLKKGE